MSVHDMTLIDPPDKSFVYSGVTIRDKGEMLSLTDMWKAAGADPMHAPAQWQRLASAEEFIAHVEIIVGKSHNNLIETKKRAGTWAHWQIAMAYAKYLSPEFHMWCNEVVRAHMEGAPKPVGLPQDVLEQIERSFGIMKMLSHKVTEMEKSLPLIASEMADRLVTAKLAESALLLRKGKTAKEIWDAAGLPPKIKASTVWFGNRLKEGGCLLEGRVDRGSTAIRLFDPDKAETLLRLGLLHKSKVYASERMGQGRFKLIGGKK